MAAATVLSNQAPLTNGHTHTEVEPTPTGVDVDTVINYYTGPTPQAPDIPKEKLIEIITGDVNAEPRNVRIHDARKDGMDKKFSIDENGFQFLRHKSEKLDINFYDSEEVKEKFYPECEEMIKKLTGAKETLAFQHVFRNANPAPCTGKEGTKPGAAPLTRAHIDLSPNGARTRLSMHVDTDEELEAKWKSGYLILSIWRPLTTVYRDPLCVMDTRTLEDEDMVNFSHPTRFKDKVLQLERVTIRPPQNPGAHKWYYLSKQEPDECLIIKFTDSREGKVLTGCPHSAFVIPDTDDLPSRSSVETRVMAFF